MIRNRVTTPSEERQLVADFFGIPVDEVLAEIQSDTFSIFLAGNEEAQEKYKICNPYGNGKKTRGAYDFTERLLVFWNGTKVTAA